MDGATSGKGLSQATKTSLWSMLCLHPVVVMLKPKEAAVTELTTSLHPVRPDEPELKLVESKGEV